MTSFNNININKKDLSLETLYKLFLNHISNGGDTIHDIARPGYAGFVPNTEGGSLIHGVLGAKGSLIGQDVNLNDVRHGGVYLIDMGAKNHPYADSYVNTNATLFVFRNFSTNFDAREDQVVVIQILVTHNQTPDIAFRYSSSGNYREWKYLTPFLFYTGNTTTLNGEITLKKNIKNFDQLEIEYTGLNSSDRRIAKFHILDGSDPFNIHVSNLPNDTSLSMYQLGEIRAAISDDGLKMMFEERVAKIDENGYSEEPSLNNVMRVLRVKGYHQL